MLDSLKCALVWLAVVVWCAAFWLVLALCFCL